MGQILSIVDQNIPVDSLGRSIGYRVTGVNINDVAGILMLTWVRTKNLPDGSEDIETDIRTEKITDDLLMVKLDSTGAPVMEDYTYQEQNPDTLEMEDHTGTRPQKTGAFSQWISILKNEIANVSPTMLITGFILEKENTYAQ